jgi:hypothetical protein
MKRLVVVLAGLVCALFFTVQVEAHQGAGFGFKGEGATLEIDPAALQKHLLPGYNLLKANCTKCHTQERIVRHLQDNVSRGTDYEPILKALIMKKLRMSSGLSKTDGKAIMDFLLTLYQIEMLEHAKLK